MTPSRVFAVCATLLVLGMPLTAGADPGDPRLVSGVLEWPVVATSTPFVIIRGDNGVLYYVSVAAARRAGAVKAGARVSVLGIEGPNAHEIRAVGMGSGPTADAALADLQAAPAPPAVAPAPAGATPVAAAAPPAAPGPAGAAPAPVAATPPTAAPSPAAITPPTASTILAATTPAASAAPTPAAAPASEIAAAPKPSQPATAATERAVVPASTTSPTKSAAPAATIEPTAPLVVPSPDQRWVELVGEVERVVGRTLVLKVNGGRVSVDMSGLVGGNAERLFAPGSTVKVYGVPVELKFRAMGFLH
jgi:hypothetical protein